MNRAQILQEGSKISFNVFCWLSWIILHQNDMSHAILISNPIIYSPIKYIYNFLGALFHPIKGAQSQPKMPKMNFDVFLR